LSKSLTNISYLGIFILILVLSQAVGCAWADQARESGLVPKGVYIGIGMVGRPLKQQGDDVGPAEEIPRMILTECPAVNIGKFYGYEWPVCQPNDPGDGPNVYDWSKGDVANTKRIVGKARTAYNQVYGNITSWLEFDTPRYWQKYEEFVEAMTIHMNELYGEVDWIFDNEPNTSRKPKYFKGNWADWYMYCLKHFYAAVHRANAKTGKNNRVIAGNLAGQCAGGFEELYARGLKDYSDVLGQHAYPLDIRSGVEVADLAKIHKIQVKYGDPDKKIFVAEGWGSGRSAGFERNSPGIEPSADEIENMWLAMTVGWDNFMTPRENWDPSYLYGASFFCGADNWGARNWRRRAQVLKDTAGNVTGFVVDGYRMTPDIAPQFWNGGMMDWYGNSKDCLMHVFPGNGLVFMNPGFELKSSPPNDRLPHFWSTDVSPAPAENYSTDDSAFHGGSRSLKLTRTAPGSSGISQMSAKRSVVPEERYSTRVWCKTEGSSGLSARFYLRFVNLDGSQRSEQLWAKDLIGAADWRQMEVTASAPSYASRAEVGCCINGVGTAWFDDVTISAANQEQVGDIKGYTLDENQNVVPCAIVRTTTGGCQAVSDDKGYYEIRGTAAGTYDIVCRKSGYVPFKVEDQTVAPGKLTLVSFNMGTPKLGLAVTQVACDKTTAGVGKGVVNAAVVVSNSKPYPVAISDVGVFIEQNGRDSTAKFLIIPSSANPKMIPANGESKFSFTLKPLPTAGGGTFTVNAYVFGQENRPNLLKNGTFDLGEDHPYWSWRDQEKAKWMLDASESRSSPFSLRLTVESKVDGEFIWAGNDSALVTTAPTASPGRCYIVGAYHKDVSKGRVSLNLFIEEYYYDGENLLYNGRRAYGLPHRDTWANDYMIYETGDPKVTPDLYPANRLKVSVGAWIRESGVRSTSWWDDVYLKEEGDWLADDRAATGARLTVMKSANSKPAIPAKK